MANLMQTIVMLAGIQSEPADPMAEARRKATDEKIWRTTKSKNGEGGKHYKLDTETGNVTAGNIGTKNIKSGKPSMTGPSPNGNMEHYLKYKDDPKALEKAAISKLNKLASEKISQTTPGGSETDDVIKEAQNVKNLMDNGWSLKQALWARKTDAKPWDKDYEARKAHLEKIVGKIEKELGYYTRADMFEDGEAPSRGKSQKPAATGAQAESYKVQPLEGGEPKTQYKNYQYKDSASESAGDKLHHLHALDNDYKNENELQNELKRMNFKIIDDEDYDDDGYLCYKLRNKDETDPNEYRVSIEPQRNGGVKINNVYVDKGEKNRRDGVENETLKNMEAVHKSAKPAMTGAQRKPEQGSFDKLLSRTYSIENVNGRNMEPWKAKHLDEQTDGHTTIYGVSLGDDKEFDIFKKSAATSGISMIRCYKDGSVYTLPLSDSLADKVRKTLKVRAVADSRAIVRNAWKKLHK